MPKLSDVTKVVGTVWTAVEGVLPEPLRSKVAGARKAVVAGAGTVLATAPTLTGLVHGQAAVVVAAVVAVATTIATFWTANAA